jgi:hypothetical protein
MYVCVWMNVCVVYVWMHVCICICVYVCMHVCICTYIYINKVRKIRSYVYIFVRINYSILQFSLCSIFVHFFVMFITYLLTYLLTNHLFIYVEQSPPWGVVYLCRRFVVKSRISHWNTLNLKHEFWVRKIKYKRTAYNGIWRDIHTFPLHIAFCLTHVLSSEQKIGCT